MAFRWRADSCPILRAYLVIIDLTIKYTVNSSIIVAGENDRQCKKSHELFIEAF